MLVCVNVEERVSQGSRVKGRCQAAKPIYAAQTSTSEVGVRRIGIKLCHCETADYALSIQQGQRQCHTRHKTVCGVLTVSSKAGPVSRSVKAEVLRHTHTHYYSQGKKYNIQMQYKHNVTERNAIQYNCIQIQNTIQYNIIQYR